ncbi:MAG: FtsX-like permease family protein, partial [Alphaproteobacteria bacterium]
MIKTISLRRMWEHKLRTILTIVGIALGVAGYIAVDMITNTLTDSFSRMIDEVAGKVQLQVYGGEAGVDEAVYEEIKDHPALRVALPVIQTSTKSADGQSILILAVDTLNDKLARDYKMKDAHGAEISDPLLFLNARNSLLVSRELAQRKGWRIDQEVELITSEGRKKFMIRGLLEAEGPATAFGGNFALMDVYAAQLFFGREGKFDSIDLILNPEVTVPDARAALLAQLGDRYDVVRPQQRTEGVENMVTTFDLSLSVLAMVVLAMGVFIIINTVTTSVLQRRREIGIQRMVGVTRWSIWGLFALEGVLFGLFGSALGIAGGFVMGRQAVLFFASQISSLFVMVDMSKVTFSWMMALKGSLMGVLISLGASLYPAWQATRITPLEVLQFGPSLSKGKGIALWRWLALLAPSLIVIVYLIFAPLGQELLGVRIMMIAILLAAITFTPLGMMALMHAVRAGAGGRFGTLLRLAADNIVRDLGRAAMTVAAFMVGLAVMLQIYFFVTSTKTEIIKWIDEALTADLLVTNSAKVATQEAVPVTEELGDEIARIPGVESVGAVRLMYHDYGEARIVILALPLTTHLNQSRFRFVRGEPEPALQQVLNNEGVLLTQNLILRQKMEDPQEITLNTPTGKRSFPVVG